MIGLIALCALLSMILGACAWLMLGDRFPISREPKWPIVNNILCYATIVVVPLYLGIFFFF